MQVICNTEDFQITEKTAVTLGKFDGIHKGHQRLLNALLEKKKQGLKTVVFLCRQFRDVRMCVS